MAQTNVQVFSGNVGIGTDGPVAKLHIKTGTTLSSSIESLRSNAAIRISAAGDNNDCMTFGLFDDVNGSGNNPIGYIQHSWDSDSDIGRPLMLNPRGGSVGIGTTNPVGQLEVHGQGQTTTTSFSQTGNMGGILTVKSSGGSPGDGGGIMFGANQGYFAAIKGTLSDGTDNTSGELMFCTRNPPSSSTMQVNMVINRAGNVGIGTTGPAYPLHVVSDTVPQVWIEGAVNSDAVIQSGSGPSYRNTYHRIRFKHYALQGDAFKPQNSINFEVSPGALAPVSAMTINGWGRVGIGRTDPNERLDILGGSTAGTRENTLRVQGDGSDIVPLINAGSGGQNIKTIAGLEITAVDAPVSVHGRHSYIESVSAGDTYNTDLEFRARSSDGNYQYGGSSAPATKQARISHDGKIYARVGTSATGADYAELFEWDDGNPDDEDRTGMTVKLTTGGKIAIADTAENVIGVVSVIYGFLGNDQWDEWVGKYVKDSLGRTVNEDVKMVTWRDENDKECTFKITQVPNDITIPENAVYYTHQEPKINPAYDETKNYMGRSRRKEWSAIGLVGRLRIIKGYPKSPRWIKIQDIDENVEEYLAV